MAAALHFGMDEAENTLVSTSHIAGAMNYPSTTQALFALIVMIIVLLFILVYCCWGTFSCTHQDESTATAEEGTVVAQQQGQQVVRGTHMVIVPINNMIYVGDPESRRIYQIPLNQDKPPAYTEAISGGPPPPYAADNSTSESPAPNTPNVLPETRTNLPDLPPSYNDCLSAPSSDKLWQTILNDLAREQQGRQNPEPTPEPPEGQHVQRSESDVDAPKPSIPTSSTPISDNQDQKVPEAPDGRQEGVVLHPANLVTQANVDPSYENRNAEDCEASLPATVQSS
ncbi:uncharacterized protein LOC121880192 isoform X1 [Homarus americanus]|uniref:uncharacterized protein LOC121880192 isoform X1 n=1 Tax=Homarus americanus TaxID=6706 RepID=UPI001C449A31|nr:uncharacterized protein LOC121880192 isoform X1 [Homarus americanus]XP_042243266.1 uncharacterized protein LOC121880192 isoform X1 [Homarus americanus]XP_042243268.1 uncharacterized protein LOC121880192 isoform X1 [Homarus americanus]